MPSFLGCRWISISFVLRLDAQLACIRTKLLLPWQPRLRFAGGRPFSVVRDGALLRCHPHRRPVYLPACARSASRRLRTMLGTFAVLIASRLAGLSPTWMSATMPMPACGVHFTTYAPGTSNFA